jgi:hypothetical protein
MNTMHKDEFGHYLNPSAITKDVVKIGIIELDIWKKTTKIITDYEAFMFKLPRIQNLMNKTNQSFEFCENRLMKLAKQIQMETKKGFGYCFEDAYNELIKK